MSHKFYLESSFHSLLAAIQTVKMAQPELRGNFHKFRGEGQARRVGGSDWLVL